MQTIIRIAVITVLATCWLSFDIKASVSVTVGPTQIPSGNAVHDKDITVHNEHLAFSIAVESAPPWGVARGGILDIAEIHQGEIGADRASLVDFIPNNWSSWPTTYQNITIAKNTPEEVIIKTQRDWGRVTLETVYSLKSGDRRVHLVTQMTNNSDKPTSDLLSGYVLWPDGGYLFGVPGMYGIGEGLMTQAFAKWNAAYDKDWSIGLHAHYANIVGYQARDLYLSHVLAPGQKRTFEGWLQVSAKGDLSAMVEGEIKLNKLASGRLLGHVTTRDGVKVETPAIVVLKNDQPYTWVVGENGEYNLQLPVGEYQVYATAKQFSQSPEMTIKIIQGKELVLNFNSLLPPGEIAFQITEVNSKTPLDARISIEKGDVPLIEYLGIKTIFTELNKIGYSKLFMAPGEYQFKVSAGEGFKAKATLVDVKIEASKTLLAKAQIDVLARPEKSNWYSADLHHHSDVLDGSTATEYVLRSQLAAGLDLAFLSDHDSSINHQVMADLARSRNIPFIPSMEISPSWGHFNVYPLQLSQALTIDSGTATVDQVFQAAKKLGASTIQVNHPLIPFGYLTSVKNGTALGKYNPDFNLLEINAGSDYMKTIERAREFWNEGKRYYLSAGSDTHNVWNENSGQVRAYVNVNDQLTPETFINNLRNGHSYVTFGPLIFPKQMFGTTLKRQANSETDLAFDIQAVNGLKSVKLLEHGLTIEEKVFNNIDKLTTISFSVKLTKDTWYSIVVEDAKSAKAFSNPIWIELTR
ncbi:MAG: hypothetical protein ACI9ZT_001359 [Gammaproteobacteria bacterium]|jgi:hypothetical protein